MHKKLLNRNKIPLQMTFYTNFPKHINYFHCDQWLHYLAKLVSSWPSVTTTNEQTTNHEKTSTFGTVNSLHKRKIFWVLRSNIKKTLRFIFYHNFFKDSPCSLMENFTFLRFDLNEATYMSNLIASSTRLITFCNFFHDIFNVDFNQHQLKSSDLYMNGLNFTWLTRKINKQSSSKL